MSTFRLLIITLVLMLAGAAMVVLRAEQAQLAYQAARLRQQELELQRTVWHQQLEIARLRAPNLVRQRRDGMKLMAHAAELSEP
ncbi:MAG: hypothetical protein JSU68_09245 [Phycisphaerales bacterium]|nr:MAG: hypothetical protein JSU68_09245 [Phycisphaerales bacterium]